MKKTWKRIEKPTEEQEKRWPWSMRLPCRSCTYENNGVEVWKDFDEIASKTDPRPKLWSKNLAQGEDLVCMNCFRTRFQELATKEVMVCDDCHQQLPRNRFPRKEQEEWQALVKAQFRCNTCQEISVPQRSGEIIACIDCGRGWPENHFNEISVLAWKEMGELAHAARCARCEAQQKKDTRLEQLYLCSGDCKKKVPLREFDPCTVKRALDGAWGWSPGSKRLVHCQKCRYPDCKQCLEEGVDKRTPEEKMYPTTAAHYHNGTDFYCRAHRYPPCPGCGAPRPRRKGGEFHSDHSVFNQPVWLCSTCKTADVENNRKCDTRLPAGLLQCYQCKERKPRAEFGEGVTHHLRDKWRCLQCQYPRCVQCYTTRPRSLRPTTAITREYTCSLLRVHRLPRTGKAVLKRFCLYSDANQPLYQNQGKSPVKHVNGDPPTAKSSPSHQPRHDYKTRGNCAANV